MIGGAHRFTAAGASAFLYDTDGHSVIGLAVRWYLRFRLKLRRGGGVVGRRFLSVDPSTVFDGMQKFTPLYQDAAKTHRHRVGPRWSVDGTYIKVARLWGDVYRTMDEYGQVVEMLFQERR